MLSNLLNTLLTVVNIIPYMVWAKGLDHKYVFVNKAWEEVTGVRYEKAVGRDDVELWGDPGNYYIKVDDEIVKYGKSKIFKEFTVGLAHEVWLKTTKIPVYDANGTIIGVVGIAQDISNELEFESLMEMSIKNLENLITE